MDDADDRPEQKPAESLGWKIMDFSCLRNPPELLASIVYGVAGILLLYASVFFFVLLFRAFCALISGGVGYADEVNKLLVAIAGIIGAPFVVWRVLIAADANRVSTSNAAESSRVAQENLYTGLLTKAVEQLGATREEKTWGDYLTPEGKVDKIQINRTIPNIEVRLGGIYALQKLALDYKPLKSSIIEILCAYIRENAGRPPKINNELERIFARSRITNLSIDDILIKENHLKSLIPRIDIQTAIRSIGTRLTSSLSREFNFEHISLENTVKNAQFDLTNTNLSGIDFSYCNFELFDFSDSYFEKAIFNSTQICGAKFANSKIVRSKFMYTQLQYCYFNSTYIYYSDFNSNYFNDTRIFHSKFEYVNIQKCDLQRIECRANNYMTCNINHSKWNDANIQETVFVNCHLMRVGFEKSDFLSADFANCLIDGANFSGAKNLTSRQLNGNTYLSDCQISGVIDFNFPYIEPKSQISETEKQKIIDNFNILRRYFPLRSY